MCGTDQTSEWCNSKIDRENPTPACKSCFTKQPPPDRVCQALKSEGNPCGLGVSVVNRWDKSPRNKDLWFCFACYHKEVRIPQTLPRCSARTVSTHHLASFVLFIFRRSLKSSPRMGGSARSAGLPRSVHGRSAITMAGLVANAGSQITIGGSHANTAKRRRRRRSKRRTPQPCFYPRRRTSTNFTHAPRRFETTLQTT